MAYQAGESRQVSAVDTEPQVTSLVRDFQAMATLLAEADSLASTVNNPSLAKVAQQHQFSLLTELTTFVEKHPEVGSYYKQLGAYVTGLGLDADELDDDERLYESKLFSELFEVEKEVITDTIAIYLNGELFSGSEELIVLFEILEAAEEPLSGPTIRERGLLQYVRGSNSLRTGGNFHTLKKNFENRLEALGLKERLSAPGSTSNKRYSLDLSGLTITRDKDPELTRLISKDSETGPAKVAGQEAASHEDTLVGDASTNRIEDTPTSGADPGVQIDPEQDPSKSAEQLDEGLAALIIRGEKHTFTQLQRTIIDAVLAGNHYIRDIVRYLQGGNDQADQSYYHEVMQALFSLGRIDINGVRLLSRKTDTSSDSPRQRYELPANARIDHNKGKDDPILRFTDPSTTQGEPGTSAGRRRRASLRATSISDGSAPVDPETKPPSSTSSNIQPQGGLSGVIAGLEMSLSDGRTFKLQPQQKHLLEALASGKRLTVGEIVTQLHGESDSTVNSVIAQELQDLQKMFGVNGVRRKQGKSGSPARWWIDTTVLTVTIKE